MDQIKIMITAREKNWCTSCANILQAPTPFPQKVKWSLIYFFSHDRRSVQKFDAIIRDQSYDERVRFPPLQVKLEILKGMTRKWRKLGKLYRLSVRFWHEMIACKRILLRLEYVYVSGSVIQARYANLTEFWNIIDRYEISFLSLSEKPLKYKVN